MRILGLASTCVLIAACAAPQQAQPSATSVPAAPTGVIQRADTETTAAASIDLSRERALVDEANGALQNSDYATARTKAAEATQALLARPDSERDQAWLEILNTAGRASWRAQDVPLARATWEHVVEVLTRTMPDDHPDLQKVRQDLAATKFTLGDLEGANSLFAKVLEIRTRTLPEEHPDLQQARGNLALTMRLHGDLEGARTLEEQVVEVFSRTLSEEHPDLQRARVNLATTLMTLGDLQGARMLDEKVLEVRTRTLPEDHIELQRARLSLASTLGELGDLRGARALQERVCEVYARTLPEDHTEVQRARLNLSMTLASLGDLDGARVLQESVLEVRTRTLPDDHPYLQAVRENLAATLGRLGDVEGSRALQDKVLEVRTRTLRDDDPGLQASRLSLAVTLKTLGDLAGARELEEQALEVLSRSLPDDHPKMQMARVNLAITLASESARALSGNRDEGRETEGRRARCASLVHMLAESGTRFARAAVSSSSIREAEERCARLGDHLSTSISFAAGFGVFAPDAGLARDAFVFSETTRASGLAAARIASLARSEERASAVRMEIQAAAQELARLVQAGATRDTYDAVISRRDRAQRQMVQLASESADAANILTEPDPAAFSERLSQGDAIVAYRRYTLSEIPSGDVTERLTDSLCAFVLRKGSRLEIHPLGPIEPIEVAVKEWREALGAAAGRGIGVAAPAATGPDAASPAARIRALIFDPLRPSLMDARHLVMVLDDVLQTVPIDALPADTSEPGGLLGDRYKIEVRSTTQELLATSKPPSAGTLVMLLGGANYSASPSPPAIDSGGDLATSKQDTATPQPISVASVPRVGTWGEGFLPLPGTLAESRGLRALATETYAARDVVLLESEQASRRSIEQLAPRTRFLHLATHGWFAPETIRSWSDPDPLNEQGNALARMSAEENVKGSSPMVLCGLALAGANLPADAIGRNPGLVTAEEVAGWDLSNCELAVLSACDTNVGERRAGQGVHSLQMALQMAGARSVITSVWKVPDEATKELMLDFYRRLWVEKKPKWQALWEAKKKLREAKGPDGRPLYSTRDWAAWVLTGEPD